MKVIRDENQDGNDAACIAMIPILVDLGINRCNIKGCPNKPTTIISHDQAGVFGMCESHYQAAVNKGKVELELEI